MKRTFKEWRCILQRHTEKKRKNLLNDTALHMPSTQIEKIAKKRYIKKHQHFCDFDFTETHFYYEK